MMISSGGETTPRDQLGSLGGRRRRRKSGWGSHTAGNRRQRGTCSHCLVDFGGEGFLRGAREREREREMILAAATAGATSCSLINASHRLQLPKQARRNLPTHSVTPTGRSRDGSVAAMSSHQGAVATTSLGDGVRVVEANDGLPLVMLTSADGSEAEIYLFGGCVTSWKVPDGKDLLFVRPDAVFNKKKPISGGIPHCFPQFGPGPMQQHGFARNMDWSVAQSENVEGNPVVTLELKDNPYSRAMWDFSFQALYKVTLKSKSLLTVLTVTNTDNKPFAFSSALHTYFRASIQNVSVKGLKGCKTLNKDPDPSNPLEGVEERESITFPGFVDCIYLNAPSELHLDNGLSDLITIRNKNWSDCVLWNPHLQMEHCYRDFVCVENAKIGKVQLEPEQSWSAEQDISIS